VHVFLSHQIKETREGAEDGLFRMDVRALRFSICLLGGHEPSCAKARRRRRAGVIFSPPCSSSSSLSLVLVLAARARMLLLAGIFCREDV